MSVFKPNFKTRSYEVEAYFFDGCSYEELPDWIKARFNFQDMSERSTGRWALRDEDGNFYRWMDTGEFNARYERITS